MKLSEVLTGDIYTLVYSGDSFLSAEDQKRVADIQYSMNNRYHDGRSKAFIDVCVGTLPVHIRKNIKIHKREETKAEKRAALELDRKFNGDY